MRRIVTDGGAKAAGYKKETNDCVVVALSIAFDISYKKAYLKLNAAGRQKNKGFYIIEFFEHCNFKDYETKTIKFKRDKRPTELEFAEKYNKGSWIIYTEGHAVAVVDGVIYDTRLKPSKNKVQYAWRFTKYERTTN